MRTRYLINWFPNTEVPESKVPEGIAPCIQDIVLDIHPKSYKKIENNRTAHRKK
jgi:hypothetical protein